LDIWCFEFFLSSLILLNSQELEDIGNNVACFALGFINILGLRLVSAGNPVMNIIII